MTPAPASMASGLISAKCPSSACKTTAIHDLCDCCYGWLRAGVKLASAKLRRGARLSTCKACNKGGMAAVADACKDRVAGPCRWQETAAQG